MVSIFHLLFYYSTFSFWQFLIKVFDKSGNKLGTTSLFNNDNKPLLLNKA